MSIQAEALFSRYPAYDAKRVEKLLASELALAKEKVIVLDDDPTGTQTVHNINVYTDWSLDSILQGVEEKNRMFFILTNSRSLNTEETRTAHKEIACNIINATKEFLLISRSDSTLRGHYPLETSVLRDVMEESGLGVDGEIICPFFAEGGRFTADNIHYVRYKDELIPAGETEFARDKTFGYRRSDMRKWVEEKTLGKTKAEDVVTISLDELRATDYDGIERKLANVNSFNKVIVNAIAYDDIKVFVTVLLRRIRNGQRFILRSAAAIVKVIGGVGDKPLLERDDLKDDANRNGGLIIVGSHVKKTSDQLEALKGMKGAMFIEINQHLSLNADSFNAETERVIKLTEETISSGKTAVVYTRRQRFDLGGVNKEAELELAALISAKVTSIVEKLNVRPAFLVAKGGITSSDIGVKGLNVKKALVLGQILPGVPVWYTGAESKFPDMPYVIFPGNVGDNDALRTVAEKLI